MRSRTFIIAEAGVNHNGSFEEAMKLASAAKDADADAVKYQLFSSQKLWGDDRIKHLELTRKQMSEVAIWCKSIGIEFMCTPFGIEELEFLKPKLKRIKIASGCIGNHDLLDAAADTGMPVILSTGMSTSPEVAAAVRRLQRDKLTLLHCTSSYPCRLEDVNLKAIELLQLWPEVQSGLSDHTQGITVPIAAVALGATVIEKHLTMDRNQEGPDHKSSIAPLEFNAMVMAIREVETALGDGVKRVMDSEQQLKRLWSTAKVY